MCVCVCIYIYECVCSVKAVRENIAVLTHLLPRIMELLLINTCH